MLSRPYADVVTVVDAEPVDPSQVRRGDLIRLSRPRLDGDGRFVLVGVAATTPMPPARPGDPLYQWGLSVDAVDGSWATAYAIPDDGTVELVRVFERSGHRFRRVTTDKWVAGSGGADHAGYSTPAAAVRAADRLARRRND